MTKTKVDSKTAAPAAKAKPEVKANPELLALLKTYDEVASKAESYFIEFVEFIQSHEVPRGVVVATIMEARGVTFQTATSQYSRMKKIIENQEVLQELKDGAITLRVAREKTKTPNARTAEKDSPAAKEKRFDIALKAIVTAIKEGGYSLNEALESIKAELKSAGVK